MTLNLWLNPFKQMLQDNPNNELRALNLKLVGSNLNFQTKWIRLVIYHFMKIRFYI